MKTKLLIIEIIVSAFIPSCTKIGVEEYGEISIEFAGSQLYAKSSPFDEFGIYDINLWIYAPDGTLEQHIYKQWKDGLQSSATISCNLLFRREYSFYTIANAGSSLGNKALDDLMNFRLYMPYPDGGARGMPMAARAENVAVEKKDASVKLFLERMLSRLDLKLDIRELDDNVEFHLMGIRVGNCPKCVRVFGDSFVRSKDELFSSGYYSSGADAKSVYLFENRQGSLNPELCSYIEVEIDYSSDKYFSTGARGLVYRFYLRENDSYDIVRNCIYTVTVCPHKDGLLSEDSWRVDKSSLVPAGENPHLEISPDGSIVDDVFYEHYYTVKAGGSIHFDLDFSPPGMKVYLRPDLVEDEDKEKRAEYIMDADGKGFTVNAYDRKSVTMMQIVAEEPLNDSETIIININ